ncbi:putative hydro-lyase [Thermogemmatispora sp.]|uniref:putative hydro-lyase n=1 Tax=Thermogemmatispora sp. TaxID=1968838 RepID=UPI0035E43762
MQMEELAHLSAAEVRQAIRAGRWRRPTTGLALGYVQANLVILPADWAEEFAEFCRRNPQALPLLEMTAPGDPEPRRLAPGADLRTDLPRYRLYREGRLVEEREDLLPLWRSDLVAFLLGCSFSAERALLEAGVRLRHLEEGRNVAMYRTSRPCQATARLHGPLVVSMRPLRSSEVGRATEVTARYPLAHGAPVHCGDPAALGIADLARPDWGDPIDLAPEEVPVFWACGVTPQAVIAESRPPLAITHAPGYMFITDWRDQDIDQRPGAGLF